MNKTNAKSQAIRVAKKSPPTENSAEKMIIPINCYWQVHFKKAVTENGLAWEFEKID